MTSFLKPTNIPGSFKNNGYLGNSLFSDLLKELGYKVSYTLKPMAEMESSGLIILNLATNVDAVNSSWDSSIIQMIDYVRNGGQLLILYDDIYSYLDLDPERDMPDEITDYESKSGLEIWHSKQGGTLMIGSVDSLSNTTVSMEREITYEILKTLHPHMAQEGVLINEYYLYVKEGSRSLWNEMPEGLKYVIYEIILAIIVGFWLKGRRFGKARILYEETEPDEYQYAKAVGQLYYRAQHWQDLIVDYRAHLLERIHKRYHFKTDEAAGSFSNIFIGTTIYDTAMLVEKSLQPDWLERINSLSKSKQRKAAKEYIEQFQLLERYLDENK